jgi:ubiquinone/menaquinone biosynthesis C-methylase UbiE
MVSRIEPSKSNAIKLSHEYYLDRWLGLYDLNEYRKWLFSGLIERLKEHLQQGSILELGCSKGHLTRLLCENNYNCIGTDISKTALSYAKDLKTVRIDSETLPFKNNVFEAVVAIMTIEHLPHPAECVKEVFRVLKKNGLFIVITPDRSSFVSQVGYRLVDYTALKNPYHVGLMNQRELKKVLNNAGFEEIILRPFHNGFYAGPYLKKIINHDILPIPFRIPIPGSAHQMCIAFKKHIETDLEIQVEIPETIRGYEVLA